ncbi:hypothetical protein ACSFA0_22675 [Variovorax sp. LT1P1]|uniref:hypothetical protein n=1 Tax=Variovorax sp. LT1P1 TaxID=3443730 RepID=UPI003F47D2F4
MILAPDFAVTAAPTSVMSRAATADCLEQLLGAILTGDKRLDDLDVALLTRAVQGLRDAGVLVAELQALALEAMPQVRREYLDLASKYAGTPYESDAAYQQVQTRYRRFEAAINRSKDPASTGSAAVEGVQA